MLFAAAAAAAAAAALTAGSPVGTGTVDADEGGDAGAVNGDEVDV